MSSAQNSDSAKAWLQELKSNRKTQAAMAMFVVVVGYLCYELFVPKGTASGPRRANSTRSIVGQPLDPAQAQALQNLPNLAGLHRASELPDENRMYRDLFLFDTPPPEPKPEPPKPPPPPPKPPTEEELAAAARRAEIDREVRGQPSDYKFIAILQGRRSPVKGAFQKGDDINFFQIGDEASPNWKLASITDEEASFQNTKFNELKYAIKAQLPASGQASDRASQQVTNFY